MKLIIDKENDAIYFRLDDSKMMESEEVEKGIVLDFDENENIVGIEILNISSRSKKIDLNSFQLETA